MRRASAVLALMLSACSTMDHVAVPGWPPLAQIIHEVPNAQMRDRCAPFVGLAESPEGCAIFYLPAGECHIWVSADFPRAGVLDHEKLHCAGFDHAGSTAMAEMLKGAAR